MSLFNQQSRSFPTTKVSPPPPPRVSGSRHKVRAEAPGPAGSLLVPPLSLGFQKLTAPITHGPRPQARLPSAPRTTEMGLGARGLLPRAAVLTPASRAHLERPAWGRQQQGARARPHELCASALPSVRWATPGREPLLLMGGDSKVIVGASQKKGTRHGVRPRNTPDSDNTSSFLPTEA